LLLIYTFLSFFTPEQPAGRAYPGEVDLVIFFAASDWVLLGDVFGLGMVYLSV
jgi:hypothetical protein